MKKSELRNIIREEIQRLNEEYKVSDLKFVNGKAIVKNNRKIIGHIIDRKEFYKINNIKSSYSKNEPYQLNIKNVGVRNCKSLEDAIFYLNKYS